MTFLNIIGIAIALAMDAFSVAIASGACLRIVSIRQVLRLSWHFGFFQALMPVIGWYSGAFFVKYIEQFDHWIAFSLLAFVGFNMIREAFTPEKDKKQADPTKGLSLIILSLATSIDALAVGITYSVLQISIWFPALIIGIVALIFTGMGLYIGCKTTSIKKLSTFSETLGGSILLIIGFKLLFDHGVF